MNDLITRRAAITRVAYLLGGALSASTVAGVLAGCERRAAESAGAAFTPDQLEMVATLAEHILPETDTPGARTARVHEYVDTMLTDYYPAADRARFLAGLERANARARALFGRSFLDSAPPRQLELVRALAEQAFRQPDQSPLPPADPVLRESSATGAEERTLPVAPPPWDPGDLGRGSFFRTLKELVLVGYYTSEAGATAELRVNPMGLWLPDIPYEQVGRSWA